MPLYEFHCPRCRRDFEELAAPDGTPPCPHCGSEAAERRLSAPSPLKTGAFPFKPGPVHPIAQKTPQGCAAGGCGGGGGFS